MVKKIIRIISCLALTTVAFCVYPHAQFKFSANYKVEVIGSDSDKDNAFCNDFILTKSQVKFYFTHAVRITPYEMHHEYEWLPCYVTGRIIDEDKIYKWKIRLIGICELTKPNGEAVFLGCKNCDEIF